MSILKPENSLIAGMAVVGLVVGATRLALGGLGVGLALFLLGLGLLTLDLALA